MAETAPVEVVTNFLGIMSDTLGYSYQSVCGFRSAIAKAHLGPAAIGKAPAVRRLTRAAFIANPPLPRYTDIWDVDKLLSYLETLHPLSRLSDFELGMKTAALVTIFSLSRASSVAALGPSFQLAGEEVIIPLVALEKTGRPGTIDAPLIILIIIMIIFAILNKLKLIISSCRQGSWRGSLPLG